MDLVLLLFVFTFLVPGCEVRCDINIKPMCAHLYKQLLVWWLISYFYFCVRLCWMVSYTSCMYEQSVKCHCRDPWIAPGFMWGPCCSSFCVICILLIFALCALCPMFPFLIAALGLSNVYLGVAYIHFQFLRHDIMTKAAIPLHQT